MSDPIPSTEDAPPTHFVIPDILSYCPFPLRRSPYYEAASAESDAWFETFNVYEGLTLEKVRRARFTLICAGIYAQAIGHDEFRICCDFMNWLFSFDDLADDGDLKDDVGGMEKAARVSMQVLREKTCETDFKFAKILHRYNTQLSLQRDNLSLTHCHRSASGAKPVRPR